MKIIDRETGKRIKDLKKNDPIKRNVTKDIDGKEEFSPMSPPPSYEKKVDDVNVNNPSLIHYIDEHHKVTEKINDFEKNLHLYKKNKYVMTNEINLSFKRFFSFIDEELLPHNRSEEKNLFPILQLRLIENNEHGVNKKDLTAIDVMEDDHIKFIQLSALMFNLLGLAPRLFDVKSRIFTLDTFFNVSKEFIELLRLHIYREDNILFPLAQKYMSENDFKELNKKLLSTHE